MNLDPITYQSQPYRRACGQTCVAMLAGVDVEWLIGDFHAAGLPTRDLVALLRRYGFQTADRLRQVRRSDPDALPAVAVVKVAYRLPAGRLADDWHWVLWAQGRYWDPAQAGLGEVYPPMLGEITSYLEIFGRRDQQASAMEAA